MSEPRPGPFRYAFAQSGDISAFLGLCFDNVAQLIVFSTILIYGFRFPEELVLTRMLPGTALGVLFGDLIYTYLAFRLARRTGRQDVTAMPLGIDTVSLFGLTLGVLGPLRLQTDDPELAWQAGMALMIIMGLFKIAASFVAARVQRLIPPAAMLGTIGAIGILLIAFFPLLKILGAPPVGLPVLFLILLALLRGVRLPGGVPAVLAVVVLGTGAFYLLAWAGLIQHHAGPPLHLRPAVPWPALASLRGLAAALPYLPIALPLAFVTVIGGIDNTASAAAAGDAYDTRDILLTEGVSTLLAGFFGGVIQTTPYIGHPAYKAMGGRAAYTLATALFVGLGGVLGYLALLVNLLPEVVVVPILLFIGLEITAQAFHGTERRHAPAVAACFLPVVASVAALLCGQFGVREAALSGDALMAFRGLTLLANGFVFSSLLWGAALAFLIDGRARPAAVVLLLAALAALMGLIHSPLPGGALFWPWRPPSSVPYSIASGYAAAALLVVFLGRISAGRGKT